MITTRLAFAFTLAAVAAFSFACSTAHATDDAKWATYAGKDGPGKSKKIVLISGDEEYRGEEGLPQLAKILSERHGFTCVVLFSQNPTTGEIDPNNQNHIPGLHHLADADLMVIATRFRDLPDADMKHIDDFLMAGKPVIGMRTATHAFNIKGGKAYSRYSFNYNGEPAEWKQGFGRLVLGETWINHHGGHKTEACRGLIAPDAKDHPIVRGIADGEIWGPSDVYGVRLPLPGDSKPLVLGQVQQAVKKGDNDRWFKLQPSDPPVEGKKNDPMMPVAWIKSYTLPEGGKQGQAFTTTMGAATDLESEGLRRLMVNATYHLLGLEVPAKADVAVVGEFVPTAYGFNGGKKGTKPSDYELK